MVQLHHQSNAGSGSRQFVLKGHLFWTYGGESWFFFFRNSIILADCVMAIPVCKVHFFIRHFLNFYNFQKYADGSME